MTIRAATRLCGIDKSTRSFVVSALLRLPCLPRHRHDCIGRNSRFGIDTQTARFSHYTDELLILREAKRLGTPVTPSAPFSRRKGFAPGIDLQSNASIPLLLSVTGICVVLLFAFRPFLGGKVKNNDESSVIDDFQHLDQMDAAAVSGHLGNLTPDQEGKLLELWQAIFKISGTQARNDNATPTASATQSAKPDTEVETPRKRRGFGFFRSAPQQTPSSPDSHNTDVSSEEDKFGLAKQFQAVIATENPRDIREALWSMMKHDHPDSLVLRFLRARKWDVEKALVMLVSAMNWRHSKMKVDQEIMRTGEAGAAAAEKSENEMEKQRGHDFLKQSRMGKSFLHGVDRDGRPICVVRVRLHKSGEQSPESLEKYTVFIIETARLTLKPPVDTANIIFDMTGFTLANMDYHPVKFMIQCFEANYPESLGVVLVHNAPWVFQGIWRIIRGWLDPVVAAKVHFTNHRAGLEEFISPNRIIRDLDGDEDWKYEYEGPVDGENDAMADTTTKDRLLKEREELYVQFEANTRRWIDHPSSEVIQRIKAERSEIAVRLKDSYWRLDPYLRARSLYDRQGIIRAGGDVNWYRQELS